jgi:hypothetical protein
MQLVFKPCDLTWGSTIAWQVGQILKRITSKLFCTPGWALS